MTEKALEERLGRDAEPLVAASRLARIVRPALTAGAVLVGAGLAYAAVRLAKKDPEADVAREVHLETSIAINRSPEDLYALWRDLKNLPLFMSNLESVKELDDKRSHWVAIGLNGKRVKWDAEIYQEKRGQLIAWRSLDGDVANAGSVRFTPGPKNHGTYVQVTMNYHPPAGVIGEAIGQLFGADPAQLIKEDLRRFKQIAETGEVSSTDGQSSGRALDAAAGGVQ
jgi:uncharacterized membrane protein